jgi:hypothetical protein
MPLVPLIVAFGCGSTSTSTKGLVIVPWHPQESFTEVSWYRTVPGVTVGTVRDAELPVEEREVEAVPPTV